MEHACSGSEDFGPRRAGTSERLNLILTPAATVPKGQLYFWSRRWQAGELQAEQDIQAGRTSRAYGPAEVEQIAADLLKPSARKTARRKKP